MTTPHPTPADSERPAEIWIDRGRQTGTPCVYGTRVPVATLVEAADGGAEDAALAAYPSCTMEDIVAGRWFLARWQPVAAPPVDAQPAGDPRPTDDELGRIADHPADSAYEIGTAGRRALYEAGEAAAAARYRAELDRLRAQCAADATWARQVEDGLAKVRGQLRDERAAHQATRDELAKVRGHAATAAGLYPGVRRTWQERAAAERDRADKAEADVKKLRTALAVEQLWEIRAGQATERADKAVALAAEMLAHLDSSLQALTGSSSYADEYRARLAALRGDTGEAS